ncbi:MAG: hypothetical protein FJ087_16285 [Deltaproteobacteria bacterium]|nr:hypothetical protein [Deltaproteobacteria bacterium]
MRLALAMFPLLLAGPVASAEEAPPEARVEEDAPDGAVVEWSVTADFTSRYVWRGIPSSEWPVVQPEATIGAFGFTLGLWANQPLGPEAGGRTVDELDPWLSYTFEIADFTIEPSFVGYAYLPADRAPVTGEFGLRLAWGAGLVEVFTDHAFDVIEYPGAYFGDLGIGIDAEIVPALSAAVETSFAWGTAKFSEANRGVAHGGVHYLAVDVSLTWRIADWARLRPHVGLLALLPRALRTAEAESPLVTGGLAIAFGPED